MRKLEEELLIVENDKAAVKWLSIYSNRYPTEKGYRIEAFMSPELIRITIYYEEKK